MSTPARSGNLPEEMPLLDDLPAMHDAPAAVLFGPVSPAERFVAGEQWLIRLRWVAVWSVAIVLLVCARMGVIGLPIPPLAVCAMLGAANALFRHWSRREASRAGPLIKQRLGIQLVIDLAALTLILHWTGGMENPFAMFFAFHMAIGATLLSVRSSYMLAVVGLVFFGGTVVAEALGLLPHYPLMLITNSLEQAVTWRTMPLVAGYMSATAMMFFGVVYFVQSIQAQRREAELRAQERERLAISRERMARIGEISSGVSHTIRNPLHGIMNCVDVLRKQAPASDESSIELLDLMLEGLQRIERVTHRLLALTREDALRRKPTQLEDVVRATLDFAGVGMHRGGSDIRTELGETPPVLVDPDRLCEALVALADNALHACSNGGSVTIATRISPSDPGQVEIEVRDTGDGIPAEIQDRVFGTFFTTKAVGDGSGLGLPIARKIIGDHGGRISIASAPGRGSRFVISLPAHCGAHSPPDN